MHVQLTWLAAASTFGGSCSGAASFNQFFSQQGGIGPWIQTFARFVAVGGVSLGLFLVCQETGPGARGVGVQGYDRSRAVAAVLSDLSHPGWFTVNTSGQPAGECVHPIDCGQLAGGVGGAPGGGRVRTGKRSGQASSRGSCQRGPGTMPRLCRRSPKWVSLTVMTTRAGTTSWSCSARISRWLASTLAANVASYPSRTGGAGVAVLDAGVAHETVQGRQPAVPEQRG